MDYDAIVSLIIIAAAIGGFISLARILLSNWRAGSRGHEESDAHQSRRSIYFEDCYNDCMAAARWDPDESENCRSVCRSELGAPLSA